MEGFIPKQTMPTNPEQLPDMASNVREQLKALRTEIEAGKDIKKESGTERENRMSPVMGTNLSAMEEYKKAREEWITSNPNAAKNKMHQQHLAIQHELIGNAVDSTNDLTLDEMLAGLTDGKINGKTAQEMTGQLDAKKAGLLDDEIAALEAVMSFGEKVSETIQSALEKIGFNEKFAALGISMSFAIEFVMNYIAEFGDKLGPLRGFSMNIREYIGIKKAREEQIDDKIISEGKKKWKSEYAEWMKKDPANAGPPPDLYNEILKVSESEEQAAADAEKQKQEKEKAEKFKLYALANNLFPGATEINAGGSESSAEKIATGWKINVANGAFKEDGLEAAGENLKELFAATMSIPDVAKITIADAFTLKGNAGKLEISSPKPDAKIAAIHIENATKLTPGKMFESVIFGTDAIDSTTPLAKLENKILAVNYAALAGTAKQNDLLAKVNGASAETAKWKFENNKWIDA